MQMCCFLEITKRLPITAKTAELAANHNCSLKQNTGTALRARDMFILICRYNRVFAYPGDDVTLSSHLSPETSAMPMEVRWFRGTECIYMYRNGQVSVGKGYEGRASLLTRELSRGNVSLTLKSISPQDMGIYSCQVLTGFNKVEKSIHLYMSGMEPLSPDLSPTLTEKDSMNMEESVLILELKKLLQQREKELQDKTRDLEATTEILKTKSSLLLYKDVDLENMSKLVNQKEEHVKTVLSELEACKRQLGQKLQEKDAVVEELRVHLQDKEHKLEEEKKKHLGEGIEQQSTERLKNTAQDATDTQESIHVLELKNLLQNKEKELEDKTMELESMSGELTRMMKLLQDRDTDVRNLAKERDECLEHMTREMEMCFRELETLGQKLQEKNAQVQELRVILQEKERELEEEKKHGHVITENQTADVSHVVLSRTYQTPKEQLKEIESWIAKKREERRLKEEEERTEALEKEFLDYVSAVKELIGKKYEKIVAWAKMMAVLQKKLEVVETDEERQALEMHLKEASEMQRQGEEQIEQLTEGIEEKRNAIEEKHKNDIEEIREKYSTVSKIEAETNILKILLPDIQTYFQTRNSDARGERRTAEYTHVDGVEIRLEKEILETGTIPVEGEVTIETEVEAVRSVKSGPEINNSRVVKLVRKNVTWQLDDLPSEDEGTEDVSNKMVNGVIIGAREMNEQEEAWEVETGEEDNAQ
ncbi:hypothetical protein KOW79_000259 [Hemibagrus wyckioides]|uniref:Ig-like domain-containing protein n=2 Tax=Hemibagrus wyckioides TaxID=337641 RepID=A0A9D3P7P2_9TELE|nr:hypothetical protein KOW79_000259 [Hemibagrus wyckioides]